LELLSGSGGTGNMPSKLSRISGEAVHTFSGKAAVRLERLLAGLSCLLS